MQKQLFIITESPVGKQNSPPQARPKIAPIETSNLSRQRVPGMEGGVGGSLRNRSVAYGSSQDLYVPYVLWSFRIIWSDIRDILPRIGSLNMGQKRTRVLIFQCFDNNKYTSGRRKLVEIVGAPNSPNRDSAGKDLTCTSALVLIRISKDLSTKLEYWSIFENN